VKVSNNLDEKRKKEAMEKTAVPTSGPEKQTSAQMKALLASYLEG